MAEVIVEGKPLAPTPADADAPRLDEARPGGEYVVGGVRVDANGNPIKDEPKPAPAAPAPEPAPAGHKPGGHAK